MGYFGTCLGYFWDHFEKFSSYFVQMFLFLLCHYILFTLFSPLLRAIFAHFWTQFYMWSSISSEPFNVFSWIFLQFLKTLWLLFMDEAQLSQGHKPLRANSLLFTNKFPEGLGITLYYSDGLSITWMVLLLLWQSLHTKKNCSLNPPSQVSAIIIKLLYVKTYVCQNFGVRDVCGQIPKSIYKRRHTFYLVIFLTISR